MRSCPLCGGSGNGSAFPYATHWNGKRFDYVACGDCATTYVDPVPTQDDFAVMYAKENYHDVHYRTPDPGPARSSLRRIESFSAGRRSLLDFGCGMGGFLIAAKAAGFDCVGVEYEDAARKAAQANSGCRVCSLDELKKLGATFDIIHLGDVLEHLPDPKALVTELRVLLSPGGFFFVEGPLQKNASLVYWSASIFKYLRRALYLDRPGILPPTHLLLADRLSQRRFFTDCLGFECLLYELDESGWPFLSETGGWPQTPSALVKHLIALASITVSKSFPHFGMFGNRFVGLFKPAL